MGCLQEMFIKDIFPYLLASICFWWSKDHLELSSLLCFPKCNFSLATFKFFSLFLAFSSLIMMCLAMIFFILNLLVVFWACNICKFMYLPRLENWGPLFLHTNIFIPHSLFLLRANQIYIHLLMLHTTHWGFVLFLFSFFFFSQFFRLNHFYQSIFYVP